MSVLAESLLALAKRLREEGAQRLVAELAEKRVAFAARQAADIGVEQAQLGTAAVTRSADAFEAKKLAALRGVQKFDRQQELVRAKQLTPERLGEIDELFRREYPGLPAAGGRWGTTAPHVLHRLSAWPPEPAAPAFGQEGPALRRLGQERTTARAATQATLEARRLVGLPTSAPMTFDEAAGILRPFQRADQLRQQLDAAPTFTQAETLFLQQKDLQDLSLGRMKTLVDFVQSNDKAVPARAALQVLGERAFAEADTLKAEAARLGVEVDQAAYAALRNKGVTYLWRKGSIDKQILLADDVVARDVPRAEGLRELHDVYRLGALALRDAGDPLFAPRHRSAVDKINELLRRVTFGGGAPRKAFAFGRVPHARSALLDDTIADTVERLVKSGAVKYDALDSGVREWYEANRAATALLYSSHMVSGYNRAAAVGTRAQLVSMVKEGWQDIDELETLVDMAGDFPSTVRVSTASEDGKAAMDAALELPRMQQTMGLTKADPLRTTDRLHGALPEGLRKENVARLAYARKGELPAPPPRTTTVMRPHGLETGRLVAHDATGREISVEMVDELRELAKGGGWEVELIRTPAIEAQVQASGRAKPIPRTPPAQGKKTGKPVRVAIAPELPVGEMIVLRSSRGDITTLYDMRHALEYLRVQRMRTLTGRQVKGAAFGATFNRAAADELQMAAKRGDPTPYLQPLGSTAPEISGEATQTVAAAALDPERIAQAFAVARPFAAAAPTGHDMLRTMRGVVHDLKKLGPDGVHPETGQPVGPMLEQIKDAVSVLETIQGHRADALLQAQRVIRYAEPTVTPARPEEIVSGLLGRERSEIVEFEELAGTLPESEKRFFLQDVVRLVSQATDDFFRFGGC